MQICINSKQTLLFSMEKDLNFQTLNFKIKTLNFFIFADLPAKNALVNPQFFA